MNISELNVGDRVRFRFTDLTYEGVIYDKHTHTVTIKVLAENVKFWPHVYPSDIICKLNETVKVSDLRVGDRIKYRYYGKEQIGIIDTIDRERSNIHVKEGYFNYIGYSDVVSKLEPQYKEIPIEIKKEITYEDLNERAKEIEKALENPKNSITFTLHNVKSYEINSHSDQFWLDKFDNPHRGGSIKFEYDSMSVSEGLSNFKAGKTYTVEIKEKE